MHGGATDSVREPILTQRLDLIHSKKCSLKRSLLIGSRGRYQLIGKLFNQVPEVLEFQFASQREWGAERLNPAASGIC